MTKKMLFLVAMVIMSVLCAGCDDNSLDKAEDFLNNSDASQAVNDAIDDAQDALEDAASDVMNMEVPEIDLPDVNAEANGEAVLNALDAVGDAVLDADTAARELQACFENCDGNYPDVAGSKVAANLACVAECKAK